MKRVSTLLCSLVLLATVLAPPAEAAGTRVIVRVNGGLPVIKTICFVLNCTVNYGLGDPSGQVFLVTTNALSINSFLNTLRLSIGVLSAEIDFRGNILSASSADGMPDALYDSTPVTFYGTTVRRGYVTQPAAEIVRVAATHSAFNVDGGSIVAVIDTGVDPNHPALVPVLLPGYDFTRNKEGADEKGDVSQSTAAVVDGVGPAWVNQSTAAVVDQSTAAVVDDSAHAAFGHGTMVAGIVHLVAPRAYILPIKAFNADGTGYTSDVIRAIYRAVQQNARVLNMSFSFASPSQELSAAISHAAKKNVIMAASVGNNGQTVTMYPAGYSNRVMGVASTTNDDVRSAFSNYGTSAVFVAAPGEGIVTTYPWGAYAAGWGTSFSTPFVAGAAALLLDISTSATEADAAAAVANAKWISAELGNGRLDLYQAVAAWRKALGLK